MPTAVSIRGYAPTLGNGPVYVMTPVPLLYASDPSPPVSVTLIADRARALVW